MLRITIIAVGKLKERYWRDAQGEYLKRLRPYANVEVIEVADAPDHLGIETALQREQEAIGKVLPADCLVIVLDVEGAAHPSDQSARWLEETMAAGTSHLTYIIGGSNGVSDEVRACADALLSFGPITLPHNLARIVLLEQVYRAFKILRGEPYHK